MNREFIKQVLYKPLGDHGIYNKLWSAIWLWVFPLAILVSITYKLFGDGSQALYVLTKTQHFSWLVCAILFLAINILLEAVKWKTVIELVEKKSVSECTRIVLAGRSLNVISPFGLGDFYSRCVSLKKSKKSIGFGAVAMARATQLFPTLFFGTISTVFLIRKGINDEYVLWVILMLLITSIIGFWFFHQSAWLKHSRLEKYVALIHSIVWRQFLKILSLSFVRYTVFSFQFYCIFRWVGIELGAGFLLLGIFWIFLIKTIVPNMTILGDLVKRELSAITFFALFSTNMQLVAIANVSIWVINLVVPALIGVFFVGELKNR